MAESAVEMSDKEALEFKRLRVHEIAEMVQEFTRLRKKGIGVKEACRMIAPAYNRSPDTILYHLRRFRPTTSAAKSYIESNALKLAMRVVRKANVDQAIDILSRPNVGVLEPVKKQEESGNGGFFISVNADTCGAVKVGIASAEGVTHAITGGAVSNEKWGPLGLQGQRSGGGQEHEDWSDPYAEGVPEGPDDEGRTDGEGDAGGTFGDALRQEDATVQRADASASGRLQVVGRGTGHSKHFRNAVEAAKERVRLARERSEQLEIDRKAKKIRAGLAAKV